ASDKLLLSRFFSKQLCEVGFEQELARKACHSAAILAASANMVTEDLENPKQILACLLEDPSAKAYAQINEHQGVIWYTKEAMQEIIYLSALSLAIQKGKPKMQEYVRTLMEAETEALYKLDRLLG
ncbi:MAG: alpha-amylase family glycosyl hydrolase, partial [Sphaerochaetaceae bacterium]